MGPVYKIKVAMEKIYINVDGKNVPVSPGMAVSVEVKTNKRRIPATSHRLESTTI